MSEDVLNKMQKQSYSEVLVRLGYFCSVCGQEQQNEAGLVHFTSDEAVQSINVCHDCLPEDFE